MTRCPSASMSVDFPDPGAPEMPTRRLCPAPGTTSVSSASASARWSARVLSTRVIARASARRSPSRSRAASSVTGGRAAPASSPLMTAQQPEYLRGGGGDVRPGPEDGGHAGVVQGLVVLGRHDAADHDDDVVATLLAQLRQQLGNEPLVPRGLAADPDHVDVVLDRVPSRLLRSLEERAHVDVEAEVGEGG